MAASSHDPWGPDRDSWLKDNEEITGVRTVSSTLDDHQLRPLGPDVRSVQFGSMLTESDVQRLAEFLVGYPTVKLRVFYDRRVVSLDFLRFFPQVKRVQFDLFELDSLDGLRHLSPGLTSLSIGWTRKRNLDLHILAHFEELQSLYVEGHRRNIEVIGTLKTLRRLALRSITTPSLAFVSELPRLEDFELRLGGTRDLNPLRGNTSIRYLELWLIRGFNDLSPIADMLGLQYLYLQALKQVTSLPDLSRLQYLRRVVLWGMHGIHDLTPLLSARVMDELELIDMRHLQPEDVASLKGHRLKALIAGLGSERKNRQVEEMFRLPRPEAFQWGAVRHLQ